MNAILKSYFDFEYHKTTLKTEVIAGVSTFLSLAYIFVVNPAILSEGGINKSAALFATVIASSIATIVMGIWAKKPFALAPGLEMSSYVVYFLILGLGVSWQTGLGAVFWSGVLFVILTISNVREKIIEAIPDSLKLGLSASVGVFLIIISLRLSEVLIYEGTSVKAIGNLITYKSLILVVGLAVVLVLRRFNIQGFVLISIVLCTILSHITGTFELGDSAELRFDSGPLMAVGALDLSITFKPGFLSAVVILFVVDFYSSIAKFIGLTQNTTILREDGKLPNQREALLVDGGATIAGAFLGTTSITTFVESGVGIAAGGRSGLTAVVCGMLMLLFIPLAPVVNLIPVLATTGTLMWVGIGLMPKKTEIKDIAKIEIVSSILMIVVTIVTFALDKAMLIGFGFYIIGQMFLGNTKKINKYLLISTLIIMVSIFLSINA